MLGLVLSLAHGGTVLDEGFDSALGTWEVELFEATGWDYEVTGGELVVQGLLGTVPATSSDATVWSTVQLSSPPFGPLDDFTAGIAFSWDSADAVEAMQVLTLELRGPGPRVANVSYRDSWSGGRGQHAASVDGLAPFQTGINSLPLAGESVFHVIREDGLVEVFLDGDLVTSGHTDLDFTYVELVFGYVDYDPGPFHTVFGTETVHRVFVLDEADRSVLDEVPAPPETGDTGAPPVTGACGEADLQVTGLTFTDSEFEPFTRDYTVQITNAGPQDVTDLRLELELPRQVEAPFLLSGSFRDAGMRCVEEELTVVCTWPGPMGRVTMDAVLRVARTGGVPSLATVQVSATQSDTCPETNELTDELPVPAGPQSCEGGCGGGCATSVGLPASVYAGLTLFVLARRRRLGLRGRNPDPRRR